MKLIDEKGRLFGKLNLFDLLILLVVTVGVAGMATRLLKPPEQESQLKSATYTVEFVSVDECYTTAFEKGDDFYEKDVLLGTVTDVLVRPAETACLRPDGSVELAEHVMYYDIVLTVTTDRLRVDGGYYIGSKEMLAGTSHIFGNGFAAATGVIREVKIQ